MLYQSSPQRVALDVPQHHPKMIVLLDGERLETTVPHVPGRVMVALVAAAMGRRQPMHPAALVTVSQRPERQVEVVGHDTVSQSARGMSQFGL